MAVRDKHYLKKVLTVQMFLENVTSEGEHSLPARVKTYLKNGANNRIRQDIQDIVWMNCQKKYSVHFDILMLAVPNNGIRVYCLNYWQEEALSV